MSLAWVNTNASNDPTKVSTGADFTNMFLMTNPSSDQHRDA